jgi:tRNA uridine 5-carboxymethylaminomethyl modification enzyme
MIDDLVTKGVTEPYRMLPSRAEYRITLREGNADVRLSKIGHQIGLLPDERYEKALARAQIISRGTAPLTDNGASLYDLLRRPSVRLSDLLPRDGIPEGVRSEAEIEAKYAGYLAQQEREIARLKRLEKLIIPVELDYNLLSNLSIEGRDRLTRVRPSTFGQASRIPGISHADLSMLAITLRR